jgi:hypothetical protein
MVPLHRVEVGVDANTGGELGGCSGDVVRDQHRRPGAGARLLRSELFGWDLQVIEERGYALMNTGGDGCIAGGIGQARGSNQVPFYVEVADPPACLDGVERAGGKTVLPVTDLRAWWPSPSSPTPGETWWAW